MKKRILICSLCAIMLVGCLFALTGCQDALGKYDASISELRTNIYQEVKEDIKVTAITGMREQPFSIDGVANKKQVYTVITLKPKEFSVLADMECTAIINGKTLTGKFLPHPYGDSYSLEFNETVTDKSFKITVKNKTDGNLTEIEYNLNSVLTEGTITANEALDIALAKLAPQVKTLKDGGRFNAEIYIRIIENPIDAQGGYFWYVAFEGKQGESYAVMMHTETKEIIAIRN